MGDAIMAFWNAPLDDPEHALHAVRAALKMRERCVELIAVGGKRAEETGRPFDPVKFGVGLNTGECSVGNMGSSQRFDYSAIGDEVNIASRLEGASKMFGVDIVASASTRDEAPQFAWLEIDQVLLKSKTRPISTYRLGGRRQICRERRISGDFANGMKRSWPPTAPVNSHGAGSSRPRRRTLRRKKSKASMTSMSSGSQSSPHPKWTHPGGQ